SAVREPPEDVRGERQQDADLAALGTPDAESPDARRSVVHPAGGDRPPPGRGAGGAQELRGAPAGIAGAGAHLPPLALVLTSPCVRPPRGFPGERSALARRPRGARPRRHGSRKDARGSPRPAPPPAFHRPARGCPSGSAGPWPDRTSPRP